MTGNEQREIKGVIETKKKLREKRGENKKEDRVKGRRSKR